MKLIPLVLASVLLASLPADAAEIDAVLAQPIFDRPYACVEHWQGNLKGLGDELGTDCSIEALAKVSGRSWMRPYMGSGRRNQDWYGWHKDVLSPCTCEVAKVNENFVVNRPGLVGKPPASFVMLKREDGVYFLLAHVVNVKVKPGDKVEGGQAIAQVGNNGYSRRPHIHLGAWRGNEPLQIRFDQASMGRLFER